MHCVYLTTYKGNKLPPFYVGYTIVGKIARGYRGSVSSKQYKSIWKQELKDNPSLFSTRIIKEFDTAEHAALYEEYLLNKFAAHKNSLYINMSASGRGGWKIGTLSKEARLECNKKISKSNKGKVFTEQHRKNLSKSHKGKPAWNKGRGSYAMIQSQRSRKGSDQHRERVAAAVRAAWAKRKGEVSSS